jgi:hypothetical protein
MTRASSALPSTSSCAGSRLAGPPKTFVAAVSRVRFVLQVDSSRSGAEEDAMVEKLLCIEQGDEPTEIVVHVNMLKEG